MLVILTWPKAFIKEQFAAICAGEYAIVRDCPECREREGKSTVVGHGRRSRTCHSRLTRTIIVRRGRCKTCGTTFTFLPCFVRPFHHYGVEVQGEALERHVGPSRVGFDEAAPVVQDVDRYPSGSTVRRWFVFLSHAGLWLKVNRVWGDAGSEGGAAKQGTSSAGSRGVSSSAFGRTWALVQQVLARAGPVVMGSLELSEASAFMGVLLLWYPSLGYVVR